MFIIEAGTWLKNKAENVACRGVITALHRKCLYPSALCSGCNYPIGQTSACHPKTTSSHQLKMTVRPWVVCVHGLPPTTAPQVECVCDHRPHVSLLCGQRGCPGNVFFHHLSALVLGQAKTSTSKWCFSTSFFVFFVLLLWWCAIAIGESSLKCVHINRDILSACTADTSTSAGDIFISIKRRNEACAAPMA